MLDAKTLSTDAIAAWNSGDVGLAVRQLVILMNHYPSTWVDVFVGMKPPQEMVRRLIAVDGDDVNGGTVTIRDRAGQA